MHPDQFDIELKLKNTGQALQLEALAAKLKAAGVNETGVEGFYDLDIEIDHRHHHKQIYFKQAARKDETKHGATKHFAYSKRPESLASGEPLPYTNYRRQLEHNKARISGDETVKHGLTTWISNLAYQPNKFLVTTILPCGCMGSIGEKDKTVPLRDGVLSAALNEFRINTYASHEKITDNRVYIINAQGLVQDSPGFDPQRISKLKARREKIGNNIEVSTTTVSQANEVFYSRSISRKHGDITTITTDYSYSGKVYRKGHEVREIIQIDSQHASAVTRTDEINTGIFGLRTSSSTRTVKATEVNGKHSETLEISGKNGKHNVHIKGLGISTKL